MIERYLYIRDKENKNVLASVGLFLLDDKRVVRTIAIRSKRDQHSKAVARSILKTRALNANKILNRNDFNNWFHSSSLKKLVKKANPNDHWKIPATILVTGQKIEINPELNEIEHRLLFKDTI